jgi:hypothetical protein
MKNNYNKNIKAIVAILIASTFLLTTISVNASFSIDQFQQSEYNKKIVKNNQLNNDSMLICPGSELLYIFSPIAARITGKPYRLVRNWENKQFPNTTIMFFGCLSSIRPRVGIQFSIMCYSENPPEKVEIVCDNKSYATIKGFSFSQIPITYYPFYYTKKGFHHLKFIPDGNESACLDVDFQVGFKGFVKNILPHLMP